MAGLGGVGGVRVLLSQVYIAGGVVGSSGLVARIYLRLYQKAIGECNFGRLRALIAKP